MYQPTLRMGVGCAQGAMRVFRLGSVTAPNNILGHLYRDHVIVHNTPYSLTTMEAVNNVPSFEGPEDVLRRRGTPTSQSLLETKPIPSVSKTGNCIPNTPLAASTISFLLGCLFTVGVAILISGRLYQLGFYLAAWSAFHWGEFAVTAGWNREKCSVDCEYCSLFSQTMFIGYFSFLIREWYDVSHSSRGRSGRIPYYSLVQAGSEELPLRLLGWCVTLSQILYGLPLRNIYYTGMILVVFGQVLRSTAMIHAATNFSHAVAFRKLDSHQLVTDGVYA